MRQRLLYALLCLLLMARLCGAALPSDSAWEVRPTNGSNLNGACFSATQAVASSGTGADQTQSNTALLSLSNMTTSGAGATTVTTVTASSFTAAMQGNCIRIDSGTNFTVGWYMINSVTDDKNIVVDRSPTAGGAGSSGTGKVGGATKSLSGQATTKLLGSALGVLAGHTIWIKNEAWNEAVTTSTGTAGTQALPIVIEGYNTSRGDQPTGSNRPHNNRAAAGTVAWLQQLAHYQLKYLWVSHAGTIGIQDTIGSNTYVGVRSSNNATTGWTISGGSVALVGCESDTNTTNGITWTSNDLSLVGSYIHANTQIGVSLAAGPVRILNSIIAANASHGIAVITGNLLLNLHNSTIDCNSSAASCGSSSVDGLNVATTKVLSAGSVLMNNIFSNNGRDGIRVTDASSDVDVWTDYNDYSGNVGTARTNFPAGSHDVTTNPTYTNSASGDYSIGTNLRNGGFPGTFPASTSVGHLDIGAVQSGAGSITQGACHRTVQ